MDRKRTLQLLGHLHQTAGFLRGVSRDLAGHGDDVEDVLWPTLEDAISNLERAGEDLAALLAQPELGDAGEAVAGQPQVGTESETGVEKD